jgi:DNA-binding SARP family transcriptional activator
MIATLRVTHRMLGAAVRWAGHVVRGLLALVVLLALIVGLPVALVHFVGWPLPEHLPTWDELQVALFVPMSSHFLLNVLACALWPVWARFTFDVLSAVPGTARAVTWRHSRRGFHRSPLQTMAGVLVGAITVSVLSRTPSPVATAQAVTAELSGTGHITVATALFRPAATLVTEPSKEPVVVTATMHTQAVSIPLQHTETVRAPNHGVYDSLWRVAQRCLGDGNRWPEIWKLNQGVTQTDGSVFTTPSLIRPGWRLQLPTPAPEVTPPAGEYPAPPQPSGPGEQPHSQGPVRQSEPADSASARNPTTGISSSTGAFVGLGFAALITVTMLNVRLRRRRFYQPGTREPDDPGRAPVVRALRIAHDSATLPHDDEGTPITPRPRNARPADFDACERAQATALALRSGPETAMLGIREGHAVALDLAGSRGLGLIGPGAHAAARALIVALLANAVDEGHGALVVIPAVDAEALFGTELPRRAPARLRVVDDMAAALAVLEAELLARVRNGAEWGPDHHARDGTTPLVLVASPTADTERRAQAILDNGTGLGLTGVLLGQWRPGGTVRVRGDGTVGATSPNLSDSLAGARLFTLHGTDTQDLLALLHAAEPATLDSAQTANADYKFIADETSQPVTETALATREPSALEAQVTSDSGARVADGPPWPRPSARLGAPGSRPLHLQVFGRLHLTWTGTDSDDLIEVLAPRQREVLVYLALHRYGCRREVLTAALWPDAPGDRPYNSFHATLSQLRRGLRTATGNEIANITVNEDGHYGLDQSVITVDLWQLQDALAARRQATTPAETAATLRRVVDLYQGDLAERIATDWIDGPREALRRDALDALSALIRVLGGDDPQQTLTLLEQARELDPYNEAIYRDLMRSQSRLGQYDSIPRTLNLLITSLAELDQQPTRDTVELADRLSRPRDSQVGDRAAS